jgi:hypothetical protein
MFLQRRTTAAVMSVCVLVLLASCSTSHYTSSSTVTQQVERVEVPAEKPPEFVHCVFFTLKPEVTDDQIEEFVKDCYLLKQIPSVRKLDAGRRDERMTRDINVTDYTLGVVVYFDDKAGHDLYNAHPVHQKLVAKHKDQWSSVRVFDFTARQ